VDHSVSLDDLVDECSDFVLVHGPDLIESVLIALLESLKLVLELLELLRELLVILSQLYVVLLVHLALGFKLLLDCAQDVLVPSVFVLQASNSV
jgi:hypothetical protein